jgi:hypothetical protein
MMENVRSAAGWPFGLVEGFAGTKVVRFGARLDSRGACRVVLATSAREQCNVTGYRPDSRDRLETTTSQRGAPVVAARSKDARPFSTRIRRIGSVEGAVVRIGGGSENALATAQAMGTDRARPPQNRRDQAPRAISILKIGTSRPVDRQRRGGKRRVTPTLSIGL